MYLLICLRMDFQNGLLLITYNNYINVMLVSRFVFVYKKNNNKLFRKPSRSARKMDRTHHNCVLNLDQTTDTINYKDSTLAQTSHIVQLDYVLKVFLFFPFRHKISLNVVLVHNVIPQCLDTQHALLNVL